LDPSSVKLNIPVEAEADVVAAVVEEKVPVVAAAEEKA
jgi:hypothetical protein